MRTTRVWRRVLGVEHTVIERVNLESDGRGSEVLRPGAASGEGGATVLALLWRISATLRLPVLGWLPDGSYRSVMINSKIRGQRREQLLTAAAAGEELDCSQAMVVRVVEYTIENRPGDGELFCLITTLLEPELAPALELAKAYHERWEIELSFDEHDDTAPT